MHGTFRQFEEVLGFSCAKGCPPVAQSGGKR
jgi:hypothetical protein